MHDWCVLRYGQMDMFTLPMSCKSLNFNNTQLTHYPQTVHNTLI